MLDSTIFYYKRERYLIFPLGSPMSPVAPPTKKSGFRPIKLNLLIIIMETRLPKYRATHLNEESQRWDRIHSTLICFGIFM